MRATGLATSPVAVTNSEAKVKSASSVRVGSTKLSGRESAAAGQPGQCSVGPRTGSRGGSSLSCPATAPRDRHESHAQSFFGLWVCDAAERRSAGMVETGDAFATGVNWQMHMPGGMSSGGRIRSKTSTRAISVPETGVLLDRL